MASLKDRLREILLRDKLISVDDFDRALVQQRERGGELSKMLVSMKLVDEDTLTQVLSESLGLPPISISRFKIDAKLIKIIPKDVAQKYQIVP
ncbi:MAG: type II secretion system protein GspE, partial [Candidatus Omnitrophica bacterium]|nr:type II secretion system protein GspE [Candidatus Omnitrophota bacterium]